MSATEANEFTSVLARVRGWTPELRLSLAQELLRSLSPAQSPSRPDGVPASVVQGMAAGSSPPPDDETVEKWLDEHRAEKLG